MIITLFGGGMGNHMFQYAFGRQLSIKNNQQLKLDFHLYNKKKTIDPDKGDRLFELNQFNIAGEVASIKEISKYYKYYKPDTLIRRLLVKFYKYKYRKKQFYEKPFIMEPDDNYLNFNLDTLSDTLNYKYKDVFVRGFWQSEKYFEGIKDVLLKDFTLRGEQSAGYYEMLSRIKNSNSVAVVVRRGDLVTVPTSKKTYYECPPSFFQKAVNIITDKIKNPKIFVMSDGMDWTKKNISFPYPTEYISHTGFTNSQKIMLMAACKHIVVSNSTFCWWGAWLNQNPDKIIIATKNWIRDEEKNKKYVEQLIPESWIKI